jgi:hypothetical protein
MSDWREVRRFHLSVADADSVCAQVRSEHREAADAIEAAYQTGRRETLVELLDWLSHRCSCTGPTRGDCPFCRVAWRVNDVLGRVTEVEP